MNDFKNMPVYISGPISGHEFPEMLFADSARALKDMGFDPKKIFNPEYFCWSKNESRWLHCMALCLENMPKEGIFCRLPGWEKSSGARIENYYARVRGLIICDLIGGELKLADDYLGVNGCHRVYPGERI